MDFGDAFGKLADEQFLMDAGAALGGYMGANLAQQYGPNRTMGYTVPPEVYDAGVVVGAELALSGRMKRHVQVGGGVALGEDLARRTGVLAQMGGN